METQNEFSESELSGFTGTENYHKFSILSNMLLTDGMNYLCERLQCYWLMDIVSSVQHLAKVKTNNSFIVWRIEVNEDESFKVSAYRDSPFNKENELYEQKGGYTNFKMKCFEFYQCDNIILLKSEY